jgi:hypothetical protein
VPKPAEVPGPGAYSPALSRRPGTRISGVQRQPKQEETGEYLNLGSTLGGPKYSMRRRTRLDIVYK